MVAEYIFDHPSGDIRSLSGRSLWAATDLNRNVAVLYSMELQTKDYFVSAFIFCSCISILVHFPNKSYGYFLWTATRNILSIQASLWEGMVYRAIIAVIWLIATVREVTQIFLKRIADRAVINTYLYILFYAVSLFISCVSYILITIKVRCSRHPQFHSRSKRERKLTGTALIAWLISLLYFLPLIIYIACLLRFLHLFQKFSYSYSCVSFLFS